MPISTYLNQTASRKARSTHDKYGKPTLGAAATIECRFQASTKKLINANGEEFLIDAELWVKPTQTIELDDVIVFGGSNYKVVVINIKRGYTGSIDHKKAMLVRTKE